MSEEQLRQLWASGASYQEIAAALGCSQSHISRLKKRLGLPHRPQTPKITYQSDPTPAEIVERAAEMREKHMRHMRDETVNASNKRRWLADMERDPAIRVYRLGVSGFEIA